MYVLFIAMLGPIPTEAQLPTIDQCVHRLQLAVRRIPPFRAEFVAETFVTTHEAFAAGARPHWDGPQNAGRQNRGWIAVYPEWFRYHYVQPEYSFDITEYPYEIRWDGRRALKLNPVSRTYVEILPSNEVTRQRWGEHYVLYTWQLDFITQQLRTSPGSRRFFVPGALEVAPYRVTGWESIDGIPCARVELAGQDTLWLSSRHDWTLVRRRWRMDAPDDHDLWMTSKHKGFVPINGHYMPREVIMTQERPDGYVTISRILVTRYVGIPEQSFLPSLPPGALLKRDDRANLAGESRYAFVPGTAHDMQQLTELLQRLRRTTTYDPLSRSRPIGIWSALAAALVLLTWRAVRHRHPERQHE